MFSVVGIRNWAWEEVRNYIACISKVLRFIKSTVLICEIRAPSLRNLGVLCDSAVVLCDSSLECYWKLVENVIERMKGHRRDAENAEVTQRNDPCRNKR